MKKSMFRLMLRKNPSKEKKKKFLPMIAQVKKENLFGQGLALTLDDNFQEFYSMGERVEDGHVFNMFSKFDELHKVGSLSKLTLTPQTVHQKKRNLMTLEGQERIKLDRQATDEEVVAYFERCREDKLKDLKERIENIEKLKANHQLMDTTPESLKA